LAESPRLKHRQCIGALSTEDALAIWSRVEPLLRRVTSRDHGRSSTDTIKKLIEEEKATLWAHKGLDLICITSIDIHPTGVKSCLVHACGGKGLEVCKDMSEILAEYAKTVGCDLLEIYGREGWLKTLNGFEKDITVMTRELI